MSSKEWKSTTLGEIYDFSSGLSKNAKEFGFGFPFLSFKTVFNNIFVPSEIFDLANTDEKEQQKYSVKKGDVFLTRTSETLAELGMSSVALKDYPRTTFNGFTKRLRPKNQAIIDPKFSGYYFRSLKFRKSVTSMSSLTTRASLNNDMLSRLPIIIPPLKEQEMIADILYSLDKMIELNNRTNQILEEMAQTIFKQWFVDFEFPNEDGQPYKSNDGEMVESELGEIPKGWRVGQLRDIANITMGQSPKGTSFNENNIGEVFYQGRTDFGTRFPQIRLYTTEPKRMASKGDVLLSVRAPVGDVNMAIEDCCIGRGLAALKSKNSYRSFLYYYSKQLGPKFNLFNGEGTVFGSINKDSLNNLQLIIPSDKYIKFYQELVDKFDSTIENNHFETTYLTTIRDTLLPKLMSGEIRVPYEEEVS